MEIDRKEDRLFTLTREARLRIADRDIEDAFYDLGAVCFENNRDSEDPIYKDKIQKITESLKRKALLEQFDLRMAGQIKCEKCYSINQYGKENCDNCGERLNEIDFSLLGSEYVDAVKTGNTYACIKCGTPLGDKTVCEKCGIKNLPPIYKTTKE